jgi:hypothetical protein
MKNFTKILQFKGIKPLAIGLLVPLFAVTVYAVAVDSELEAREKGRAQAAHIYSEAIKTNQIADLEIERVSDLKRKTHAQEIFSGDNFCFHHYRLVEYKKLKGLEVQNEECNLFH